MGTLYFGPYHEEIDTDRHGGYAARVMPDGTETSTFGGGYGWTGHVGYRARCECGWSGSTVYPVPDPDPMDCEPAIEQWHRDHIAVLVAAARREVWPDWQRRTTDRTGEAVRLVNAGRHRAALDVLETLAVDLQARIATVEDLANLGNGGGGW